MHYGVRGHSDEVLDLSFDSTGQRLVTASADGGCGTYLCAICHCLLLCTGGGV